MRISMAMQNLHQGPLTDSRWVRRFLQGTAQTTDEEKPLIPPEKRKGNLPTFLPFRGSRESWSSLLRQTFHPCCLHSCSSSTRPLLPMPYLPTLFPFAHMGAQTIAFRNPSFNPVFLFNYSLSSLYHHSYLKSTLYFTV